MKEITDLSRLTDEEVLALYNESVLESGSTFIAANSCYDPGNHGCSYGICYSVVGTYFYYTTSGLLCYQGSVTELEGTVFEYDPTYGAHTGTYYYYYYSNFTVCQTSSGGYSVLYCHVDVQK